MRRQIKQTQCFCHYAVTPDFRPWSTISFTSTLPWGCVSSQRFLPDLVYRGPDSRLLSKEITKLFWLSSGETEKVMQPWIKPGKNPQSLVFSDTENRSTGWHDPTSMCFASLKKKKKRHQKTPTLPPKNPTKPKQQKNQTKKLQTKWNKGKKNPNPQKIPKKGTKQKRQKSFVVSPSTSSSRKFRK